MALWIENKMCTLRPLACNPVKAPLPVRKKQANPVWKSLRWLGNEHRRGLGHSADRETALPGRGLSRRFTVGQGSAIYNGPMIIRWRRLGLRLLGLCAAAGMGFYLLLPALIGHQIKRALADVGLPNVRLKVGQVGIRGLAIRELATPDQRLRIERIDVEYDWTSLRDARIRRLALVGGALDASLTPQGQLDLGPLGQLKLPSGSASARPPLDDFSVDAQIRLAVNNRSLTLPLNVTGHTRGEHPVFHALIRLNRVDDELAWSGGSARIQAAHATIQRPDPARDLVHVQIHLNVGDLQVRGWDLGSLRSDLLVEASPAHPVIRLDGQVAIDSASLGSLTLQPRSFNHADGSLKLEASLRDVNLAPLAAAVHELAGASGRVSGQLRLRIKTFPPHRAIVDEGSLAASPGTVLTFARPQALHALLPLPSAHLGDDTQRQLVEALQDFEYRTLKVAFVPQNQDVITRIEIDGRARGARATSVGPLVLNIARINDLINTPLLDAALGSTGWLERVIERGIKRSSPER